MTTCQLEFGTKGETLQRLSCMLKSADIKPLLLFSVSEWRDDKEGVLSVIQEKFAHQSLIIRSSALNEDSSESSLAGAYTTVVDVNSRDRNALEAAIQEVIASYGSSQNNDQVLIQEKISDIKICGVLFTRESSTLAPYYIVNYDDKSGSHEAVTSGSTNQLKTYIRFRKSPHPVKEPLLESLLEASAEIEDLFGDDALDIEFALTHESQLYILQVRRIVRNGRNCELGEDSFKKILNKVFRKIEKLNAPHPGIYGSRAIYSVMTDWNPAEMIGRKPRRLALSLYKELITDSIWAYQRDNYGYLNLRSFPLLISFLGCPYIDVRASLNSFVPASLKGHLACKLVNFYSQQLEDNPTEHDKVEFNVIYSCFYLDVNESIRKLSNHGFSDLEIDRIKYSLLNITNDILHEDHGLFRKDLRKIEHLEARYEEIMGCALHSLDKIYWLVEDCKRYGTLPFAGLARAGFIAMQMLKSLERIGIFSTREMEQFLSSLNTVSNKLARDSAKYQRQEVSKEYMVKSYGHLRPGTYDINSPRYDEAWEVYFGRTGAAPVQVEHPGEFKLTKEIRMKIESRLHETGIEASPESFLKFIKNAIEGREYGKFVFTRHLSQILDLIAQLGNRFDMDREQLSHLDIQAVLDLYSNLTHEDVPVIFKRNIEKNKREHEISKLINLPQLIIDQSDVYDFFLTKVEPNFITNLKTCSVIVVEEQMKQVDLTGKIVLITSADPGYDWIFSQSIAGLITMYGGVNSHMAIRCAELQIPAAIGCGEKHFEAWIKTQMLSLDCENKQITVVN